MTQIKSGVRIDQTNFEENRIEPITLQIKSIQIILSCIDLIFSAQPNLIIESGILPLLHQNFLSSSDIYAKFSLQIFYPLPYVENFGTIKMRILN